MKEKQIIKIKRAWVKAFKDFNKDENNKRIDKNIAIDWIKILKVFVFLFHRNSNSMIKISDIGDALKMSDSTVSNALKAISQCSLYGITFYKYTIREKIERGDYTFWQNKGSDMGFMICLDKL